jgi:hypothetical protein
MSVQGTIGTAQVNLENAATEDTLDKIFKILASTISPEKLNDILGKSGFDKKTVTAFVEEVGLASKIAGALGGALGALDNAADGFRKNLERVNSTVSLFTDIAGSTRGIFGKLAEQSGIVGAFGRSLQLASEFNEKQLEMYQQLSTAGINFGGSLGDLRTSAAAMELSMDQFVGLMKGNSEAFARMGGNANEGAQNFKRLSQAMFSGPNNYGNGLKALGYTSDQVNQSMLNYIAITGGRSAKEMQDTDKLAKSAQNYMQNLDALSVITGKSREEQEEAMKKASANAAFQSYLNTLSEEEREKAVAVSTTAFAMVGEGAREAVQAQLMGVPPLTEAAQQFRAIGGSMNDTLNQATENVYNSAVSSAENQKYMTKLGVDAIETSKNFGKLGFILDAQGKSISKQINDIGNLAIRTENAGVTNAKAAKSQLDAVLEEQRKRGESTAAAQVKIQDSMRKSGEILLNALVPLAEKMQPIIELVVTALAGFLEGLNSIPGLVENLGTAIIGVTGLFFALKAYAGAKAGFKAVSGVLGVLGGGEGGGMPGAGKVGNDIEKLTKGAGPGAGGVLQGLSKGLASFGGPQSGAIITGALALAGAIAILSVGIGAAAFILGNTLPFLAEGLKSFAEIDGANLTMVGLGVGALAIGIGSLAAVQIGKGIVDFLGGIGQFFGAKGLSTQLQEFAGLGSGLKEAGEGLQTFTNALLGLTTINTDKLNVLASTMSNLNKSIPRPNFTEMAGNFLTGLTNPIVQAAQSVIPVNLKANQSDNNSITDLIGVNTQMLAVMKDVVKQQISTISALKDMNKKVW